MPLITAKPFRVLNFYRYWRAQCSAMSDAANQSDDIAVVIHYEPAKDNKDYLHRSGRTARAGRDGWAVTLAEYNQHTQVTILQRTMRMPITNSIEVFSNNPMLANLADFQAD